VLNKNIPGAILICLILFTFVGVGFYLGISINWDAYFKILAIVAVIAFIISAIINTVPSGNSKK
jgi:ABC-type siderophore export system fused ATPase/permease subunit